MNKNVVAGWVAGVSGFVIGYAITRWVDAPYEKGLEHICDEWKDFSHALKTKLYKVDDYAKELKKKNEELVEQMTKKETEQSQQ